MPSWAKAAQKPAYTAAEVSTVSLVSGKADANQVSAAIVTITAGRALALADAGMMVLITSASAATITVPADSTVNFPVGTEIEFRQQGAGLVTFVGAAGVTVTNAGNRKKSVGQYAVFALKKLAANDWALSGELEE